MTHASSGIDGLSAVSLRGNSFPGQDPATPAEQAATLASSTQMHVPMAPRDKQPSEAQQASFWDQQIANGNLSMCSVKYPTYVNVMLYGESGLGKTVSAAASWLLWIVHRNLYMRILMFVLSCHSITVVAFCRAHACMTKCVQLCGIADSLVPS
jgi:hypothetical protein